MKNPLIKRLPRELKSELGKYIVLFLFLTGVIGFVSGFLVASNSTIHAYNESFEKYNVEDGNFELAYRADEKLIEALEKENVEIYENLFVELDTDSIDSTIRIFKNREEVNKACIMEGSLPDDANEIAIDRMYADNNSLEIGDTLIVNNQKLKISGLVALSDYSAMYQNTSDMMFDATRFGVGVMTEDGFKGFGEGNFHYSYSWQYTKAPTDDTEEKQMSEDFLKVLATAAFISGNSVTNYLPQYANQAIVFTGTDMGNDRMMFTYFLYIVVIIIAFIFAITTNNTITKEANVIGTLRASGYTKGELIRHYMTMPVLVIIISALLGNILGYTVFKEVAVSVYYQSYSLPTYVTLWNADAFVKTTVIPVILMTLINLIILLSKMSLSPLKFIRGDLSKKQKKRAMHLSEKLGILKRFRLRVIFQNMPNYITIFIGVFLANVILLLGVAFPALLDKYQDDIQDNMICEYQYILKAPEETDIESAEKYCAGGLKTSFEKKKSEDVSVFGIVPDSKYIDIDFKENGIYISNAMSEKYDVEKGDTLKLKDEYADKEYSFKVSGIYYYPSGITVFMSQSKFNETFDFADDYFNGYFSNEEINDIEQMNLVTTITVEDLTKTSRQMDNSLGSVMDMFTVFGIIMFMLIIYLLSKIVIEKNAQSISMTKILGYSNSEISSLYVTSTSIVVILSLILTLPLADLIMAYVCEVMLAEYSGWLPYYVPLWAYFFIIAAGVASYSVIAFFQFRKVKAIPLDVALKNRE